MKPKSIKGNAIEEIKSAFQQSMSDGYKPMAGFFSLGEFGTLDKSQIEFHGTNVSWVALKEK